MSYQFVHTLSAIFTTCPTEAAPVETVFSQRAMRTLLCELRECRFQERQAVFQVFSSFFLALQEDYKQSTYFSSCF